MRPDQTKRAALVELTVTAMSAGIAWLIEEGTHALDQLPPDGTLTDALGDWPQRFLDMRPDLTDPLVPRQYTTEPSADVREALGQEVSNTLMLWFGDTDKRERVERVLTGRILASLPALGYVRITGDDEQVEKVAREYHERGNGEGSFDRTSEHVKASLMFRMRAALFTLKGGE